MASKIMTFFSSLLGGGVGVAGMAFLGREWLSTRLSDSVEGEAEIRRSRLEVKRQACLEALSVVDASLSQQNWRDRDAGKLKVDRQPLDVAQARECYNKLALSCDNPAVVQLYLEALGVGAALTAGPSVRGDIIVDLCNIMRKELKFGDTLQLPRDMAWIGTLHRAGDAADETV